MLLPLICSLFTICSILCCIASKILEGFFCFCVRRISGLSYYGRKCQRSSGLGPWRLVRLLILI